tara:strand:+ start:602 stop:784 length:183 start_codon:yes stop_codon:yes gene_type:complete
MTASNPPGSSFYIVPYSSLIPSHEEVITDLGTKSETVDSKPVNASIERLIKAVRDNPTPK